MYSEVNAVYVVLFTSSRTNAAVNFTFEIPQNTLKRMEQHFQDVAQKVANDKNSDSFAVHFAKKITQKPSPQQCREIMSFGILSTGNPIGSMKNWVESCCTPCMK